MLNKSLALMCLTSSLTAQAASATRTKKSVITVVLSLMMFANAADAAVMYTYVSDNFTVIADDNPRPAGSYDTNMHAEISFTIGSAITATGDYTDQVIGFSGSDGRQTITDEDATFSAFNFTVDEAGEIVEWQVSMSYSRHAEGPPSLGDTTISSVSTSNNEFVIQDSGSISACDWFLQGQCYAATDTGAVGNSANEWNVSAVPIPAAAWLFGSALLGLVGVARRKRA